MEYTKIVRNQEIKKDVTSILRKCMDICLENEKDKYYVNSLTYKYNSFLTKLNDELYKNWLYDELSPILSIKEDNDKISFLIEVNNMLYLNLYNLLDSALRHLK